MAAEYFFGEVAGQPVGTAYARRANLVAARVHQVTQQGIAGNRHVGCASIVVSGGYDTDEDYGHEIFYTGSGGQNPDNPRGPHIKDQDWTSSDNAALLKSQDTGLPVRVVRKANTDSDFAPAKDFRYDGLYKVVSHWESRPGRPDDNYLRCMYKLVQLTVAEALEYTPVENYEANNNAYTQHDLGSGTFGGQPTATPVAADPVAMDPFYDSAVEVELPAGNLTPDRVVVSASRIIRDTKVAATVKAMYRDACQVCGTAVRTQKGTYSEGAHIRPLGRQHRGPDTMNNILCLCPNHHAAFDKGGWYLDDELVAHAADGSWTERLNLHADHVVDVNFARYHRAHHGHVAEPQQPHSPNGSTVREARSNCRSPGAP